MKLIEAAEAAYASANSYFLLLWGIVAVVALTTFFEQREISTEQLEAARVIQRYEDLIAPSEAIASALNRVVAAGPHFDDPKKLFFEMRANTLLSRTLLCVFRSIRPPIPTTSAHLFRSIRPPVMRCCEAAFFSYQV